MTTPPSVPGYPIEAGVFNALNWAEYISLFRNKRLEVDDDMESSTKNVPSVETPSADTLFEGQTWGWDGIDRRAVVAQNQNELDTLKPFLHRHIPTLSPSQIFEANDHIVMCSSRSCARMQWSVRIYQTSCLRSDQTISV